MPTMSPFEKLFVNRRVAYFYHKFFLINKFLQAMPPDAEPKKVLEVGCGVGITTYFIAKKFPTSRIIATDYDASQIEIAKKRFAIDNVDFLQGDATHLSFPDEFFDACFAIFVFHHIPEFTKALREINRVLKRGSPLYVMDIPWKKLNLLHKWFPLRSVGSFTRKEFSSELERTGFIIRKSREHLFYFSLISERV